MDSGLIKFEQFVDRYLGPLNESLALSYDVKKLENHLNKEFKDKVVSTKIDLYPSSTYETKKLKTGTPATIDLFVKNFEENDSNKLNEILKFFGYYIAKQDKEQNITAFQMEPKYGVIFEPSLWNIDKMFHVTPTKYVEDILQDGLLYFKSQTHFDHPGDRVFLFWTKSKPVLEQWARLLGRRKGEDEISILEVKIEPSYKFYLDDTATYKDLRKEPISLLAAYTTNAINPKNIKLVETIKTF